MNDNLIRLEESSKFIKTADALLNTSLRREQQRLAAIHEEVKRIKEDLFSGNLFGAGARAGLLGKNIANNLGLGPKAVGPVSELPLTQLASENTQVRFIKTKTEHRLDRNEALKKTATKSGWGKFSPSRDSISLGLGKVEQYKDDVENRYGPADAGMITYRNSNDHDQFDVAGKFFPFSITHMGSNKTEIFPAYISSLNESISPTWSSRRYLGRSESVWLYNETSKSAIMDLKLFATTDKLPQGLSLSDITSNNNIGYEIPVSNSNAELALVNNAITKAALWEKISFLESMCYPVYDEEDRYSRSPFGRLNLGHLYEDQLIIIDRISITYDPLIWDINGEHYTPMIASINLSFKIIHDSAPGVDPIDGRVAYSGQSGERRFLHRSDFS